MGAPASGGHNSSTAAETFLKAEALLLARLFVGSGPHRERDASTHGRTNQKYPWLDWLSRCDSRGVRTVYEVPYLRIWLLKVAALAMVTSYQPAFGTGFQFSVGVSASAGHGSAGRQRSGAR